MEYYFDNAATTQTRAEVFEAMKDYFCVNYGNPSSIYKIAQKNKAAVDKGREQVAKAINADTNEIYFTAGGSESDNWALKGIALSYQNKGKHIITTAIEHHAILHTCQFLETQGYEVTYLPVDEYGKVSLEDVKNAIRPDTILISVMFANNEIGTIEPIAEIGKIAHEHGIIFHTDAVQAYGQIPIDVKRLGVDLLSASAHKIYGPKGIGLLYIRDGVTLTPLIFGGGQESGIRGGTENVPAIAGFGVAAKIAFNQMRTTMRHEIALRNYLIQRVLHEIPFCQLNGSHQNRLPGNANFSFEYVEGSSLLMMLDAQGICASSGSACASSSAEPSHVLTAIGLSDELAHASLRLTLGRNTTKKELDLVVSILKETIDQLRSISDSYLNRISR